MQSIRRILGYILFSSGLYFLLWSLCVFIFPDRLSHIIIQTSDTPLMFWDAIALITFIMGVGMFIASFNPTKNSLILVLILLFHLAFIAGFIVGYINHIFSLNFLPFIILNHVVWLIPVTFGLFVNYKKNKLSDTLLIDTFNAEDYPLSLFETNKGENLEELSFQSPVMVVFLRQLGCVFCQESLLDLARNRSKIESKGTKIVLVYMVNPDEAIDYLAECKVEDIDQVSDPESIFYKRFQLKRGSFRQLLGIRVLFHWAWLSVSKKIYPKKVAGDVNQMPGVFLIHKGEIVKEFVHQFASDLPDYKSFLTYSNK